MTDLSADLFGVSPDMGAVSSAILGQENQKGDPNAVSIDGAIGRAQIEPATFKQYALPGEDINNDADNIAVHNRIIHDLNQRAGGDPARVAVGYFSGAGNIAPPDSPTPWKADHKDGNGKSVSSYVSDVLGRMNPVSTAQASEAPAGRDLSAELFGDESKGKDLSSELGLIDALKYQTDPVRAAYQGTMNTIAKPINTAVNTAVNSVISPALGAVASAESKPAQGIANAIDSTGIGQWVGNKLLGAKEAISSAGDEIKDLETYDPNLEKDLSAWGQNAQLAGNLAGAKVPVESAAKTFGESPFTSLGRPSGVFPEARGVLPSDYDHIATHSAISDTYGAAKEATKPYFNLMHDIGVGETADASELKPALNAMIEDIQNTPFHEATSELSYLKQQAAKIGDDGRMPLNDMVKLKQNLNSNFNPKRFAQGIDTPYSKVGNLVDDSLAKAADRIPEFGQAKSLADKNWLNTVKAPFEDNTVLQKFWKPEDYYAKKSVDNGMLEELPDPTKQRASAMLKNIKTPVQLNAIRRVIPQNMSEALSAAKIQDITQGGGLTRMSAAGKAIVGAPNLTLSGIRNTLTNIGETIGGVPLSQSEKDLIAAAKTPSPALSTKYQKPFSDLKTSIQQQKDLAAEMQPHGPSAPAQPAPKPVLAITEKRPLIGGRGKQPRPATDEEWQNIIDQGKQDEQLGLTGTRSAQQKARVSEYERTYPANNIFNKIGDKPLRINQTALHPDTGDVRTLFPDEEGHAKGGIIKNREIHLSKKLEVKLGRKPKSREIELANYIGAHGVHRLLNQKDNEMAAHKMFPQDVVKGKRDLFFNKRKPYSVEDIRKALG